MLFRSGSNVVNLGQLFGVLLSLLLLSSKLSLERGVRLLRALDGALDHALDVAEREGLSTLEALDRLLGDATGLTATTSLAGAVRRQPFSVILLDEFEKAHRNVWDVFLQVFDDGRLTDRLGNTANFRHAIILLTSNLGAAIPGVRIGFVGDQIGRAHV